MSFLNGNMGISKLAPTFSLVSLSARRPLVAISAQNLKCPRALDAKGDLWQVDRSLQWDLEDFTGILLLDTFPVPVGFFVMLMNCLSVTGLVSLQHVHTIHGEEVQELLWSRCKSAWWLNTVRDFTCSGQVGIRSPWVVHMKKFRIQMGNEQFTESCWVSARLISQGEVALCLFLCVPTVQAFFFFSFSPPLKSSCSGVRPLPVFQDFWALICYISRNVQ